MRRLFVQSITLQSIGLIVQRTTFARAMRAMPCCDHDDSARTIDDKASSSLRGGKESPTFEERMVTIYNSEAAGGQSSEKNPFSTWKLYEFHAKHDNATFKFYYDPSLGVGGESDFVYGPESDEDTSAYGSDEEANGPRVYEVFSQTRKSDGVHDYVLGLVHYPAFPTKISFREAATWNREHGHIDTSGRSTDRLIPVFTKSTDNDDDYMRPTRVKWSEATRPTFAPFAEVRVHTKGSILSSGSWSSGDEFDEYTLPVSAVDGDVDLIFEGEDGKAPDTKELFLTCEMTWATNKALKRMTFFSHNAFLNHPWVSFNNPPLQEGKHHLRADIWPAANPGCSGPGSDECRLRDEFHSFQPVVLHKPVRVEKVGEARQLWDDDIDKEGALFRKYASADGTVDADAVDKPWRSTTASEIIHDRDHELRRWRYWNKNVRGPDCASVKIVAGKVKGWAWKKNGYRDREP